MRLKHNIQYILLLFTSLAMSQLKSPKEFLGYSLGSQFTPHHKVVDYFQYLAKESNLLELEEYGRTNENRILQVAFLAKENRLKNKEEIRKNNLSQIGILEGNNTNDLAIVWLSYNVHGNESSSTETAMITAYKLLTTEQDLLENTFVILDPCLNPDGRDRYVNWYNQIKSKPYNTDQDATEHHEPLPSGRPNHYLFDLNRDWAWATQVESSQRLKVYNKWMPHIHVDFHEQFIDNPYYFAPAAEPFHEEITRWQRELQTQIGINHTKHFNHHGWHYFTREDFDLFYPSYGDTYPTFMGAIGMTYEQAGHGQAGLGIWNNEETKITLRNRIHHHLTTGLSTLETANKNATKINIEFKDFFKNHNFKYNTYYLNGNQAKLNRLAQLLDKHEIQYKETNNIRVSGFIYDQNKTGTTLLKGKSISISTQQPKGKMVKILFEPNAKLSDSLTYDITAWSLGFAHGLKTVASSKSPINTQAFKKEIKPNTILSDAYAYAFKWNSMNSAKLLADLLKNGFRVRYSSVDFKVDNLEFNRGSILLLKGENKFSKNELDLLSNLARKNEQTIHALSTGYVEQGSDFGSEKIHYIKAPKIAVLKGTEVNSLAFGETWFYFENDLKYPVTNIDIEYFNQIDLNSYTILVLPSGNYNTLFNEDSRIKKWIENGGKLIAVSNALNSLKQDSIFGLISKKSEEKPILNILTHEEKKRDIINDMITGAIFKANVDTTHPLGFGYPDYYFTLKQGGGAFELLNTGENVVYLAKDTKAVSGFAGKRALSKQSNSLVYGVKNIGKGSVIYMAENPLFRNFWENGKLFFANAIFF